MRSRGISNVPEVRETTGNSGKFWKCKKVAREKISKYKKLFQLLKKFSMRPLSFSQDNLSHTETDLTVLVSWRSLAEFPPVSTFVAEDKCGHWLVSGPRLDLVVGAVVLAALAALEEVGLGALDGGQLRGVDALLHERLTLRFDLKNYMIFLYFQLKIIGLSNWSFRFTCRLH